MNCKNCGYDLTTENYSYCPKCGVKLKEHKIFGLIFKILFVFIMFSLVEQIIINLAPQISSSVKYGGELYIEILATMLVIFAIIFFKNTYILKEKRVGFFKGLLVGLPMLSVSLFILLGGLSSCFNKNFNLPNFIAMTLLFLFVGIYEELMCRGLIQNEFIERYGKNRKQVIISIICSSLIFGGMHITNYFAGQDLLSTIFQVFQTTILGMVLGGVYYRTKNIKVPIFLHAFYDFAIAISDNNVYWDSRIISMGHINFILSIISTVMICSIYLIIFIIMFRNININPLVKDKEPINKKHDDKVLSFGILSCVLIVFVVGLINMNLMTKYEDKLKEEDKDIISFEYEKVNKDNYKLVYTSNVKKEEISINTSAPFNRNDEFKTSANILFELNNDEFIIKNKDTGKSKVLVKDALNFVLFEDNNYIIGVNTFDKLMYLEIDKYELLALSDDLDEISKKIETYHIPYSKNIGYIKDENNKENIILKTYNPSLIIMLDGKDFKILK